jgi:hypothetical protein
MDEIEIMGLDIILKILKSWKSGFRQRAGTETCPYGGFIRHFVPPPAARLLVRCDDDGGDDA